MLMDLLRSDRLTVNVTVSIMPPGVPCPITTPVLRRIWAGFEVTPGIGRVLMVGNGGGSGLVVKQPAVSTERTIIKITGTKYHSAMSGIPRTLVGNNVCPLTRKTLGSWIYLTLLPEFF
jgi:hypothetical protein